MALATPSTEPKNSRCAGPILVMTPIVGSAISHRYFNPPCSLMPISITAASQVFESRSRVSGTPSQLFRLPSVASTRYRVLSTAAAISLVVVFPLLPVMPTTGIRKRRRYVLPRAPSAVPGVSTTIIVPDRLRRFRSSAQCLETTAADAPFSRASSTKRCPSRFPFARSPSSAKNSSPAFNTRESMQPPTGQIAGSTAPTSSPPIASAASASVIPSIRSNPGEGPGALTVR